MNDHLIGIDPGMPGSDKSIELKITMKKSWILRHLLHGITAGREVGGGCSVIVLFCKKCVGDSCVFSVRQSKKGAFRDNKKEAV